MTGRESQPVRLNNKALRLIPRNIRVPTYHREDVARSIIHIGVGGFHRAHQAVYLDDLLHEPGNSEWGLLGVGLLKHDFRMRDALVPQDCLYTVVECSASGRNARVIGSLLDFIFAPDGAERVLEKMAAPECRIVSLTITEGGYYVDQGTGEFIDNDPDVLHDLANPHEPRCSFGYLAEALDRRRIRGLPPFTIMSCDNLQQNGDVARKMILAFAQKRDSALHRWIADHCSFPNSMVDRITPATTDEHRAMLREEFAVEDAWPVVTEPFRQWVIEDKFPGGRPALRRVGAQLTQDVLPYEKIKIRLLNAGHQALSHAGRLLGYDSVHAAVRDRQLYTFLRRMMDEEVTPLLPHVPGMELESYKNTLLERFANPAINDQLSRIGMEGSARMPRFVFPSIAEQLVRDGPMRLLGFTVACWFRCLAGTDERGREIPLVDARADALRGAALRGKADVGPLLSLPGLFGENLRQSERFRAHVSDALGRLYREGVRKTLAWRIAGNQ